MRYDVTSILKVGQSLRPMEIHQSMWIEWPYFENFNQKINDSKWPLDYLSNNSVILYNVYKL